MKAQQLHKDYFRSIVNKNEIYTAWMRRRVSQNSIGTKFQNVLTEKYLTCTLFFVGYSSFSQIFEESPFEPYISVLYQFLVNQ